MTRRLSKAGRFAALAGAYWRDPDRFKLSAAARDLNTAALSYCADVQTDGLVHDHILSALAGGDHSGPVAELVKLEWWVKTDGGYMIPKYPEYNLTKAESEAKSEQQRNRIKQRWDTGGNTGGTTDINTRGNTDGNTSSSLFPLPSSPISQSPPSPPSQEGVDSSVVLKAHREGWVAKYRRSYPERTGLQDHDVVTICRLAQSESDFHTTLKAFWSDVRAGLGDRPHSLEALAKAYGRLAIHGPADEFKKPLRPGQAAVKSSPELEARNAASVRLSRARQAGETAEVLSELQERLDEADRALAATRAKAS